MKIKGNIALIILTIFAGILVIVTFVILLKQQKDTVTMPITFVEYGDFECPFCANYYPGVEKAVADLGDNVQFEYKEFPLTTIHPEAYRAAQAAEAARLQEKFSEYADLIFSKNRDSQAAQKPFDFLTDNALFSYAGQLGLNVTQFKIDIDSTKVKNKIDSDVSDGNDLGLQGTPTFYINGKLFNLDSVDTTLNQTDFENAVTKQFENYIKDRINLYYTQAGAVGH